MILLVQLLDTCVYKSIHGQVLKHCQADLTNKVHYVHWVWFCLGHCMCLVTGLVLSPQLFSLAMDQMMEAPSRAVQHFHSLVLLEQLPRETSAGVSL